MPQNKPHTEREWLSYLSAALMKLYDIQEAKTICKWVISYVSGISWHQIALHGYRFSEKEVEQIGQISSRLLEGEPIQYVLEEAHFYGRIFKVGPGILIPRRETEELVEWVLSDISPVLTTIPTILDVGTGSGCIPISIERELAEKAITASVIGLDVSDDTMRIAQENKHKLGAKVEFLKLDILAEGETAFSEVDILISNPPYVPLADKENLHINVAQYEPELALFVPDDDPLIFYRRIGEVGQHWLKEGGKLYFEVYADYAQKVADLLDSQGFKQLTIKKDMQGKNRMVRGIR
ncbi:MAG: peptide chain release factor N(5)-glutamine methyltransferase [Bacteroidota bacterium]